MAMPQSLCGIRGPCHPYRVRILMRTFYQGVALAYCLLRFQRKDAGETPAPQSGLHAYSESAPKLPHSKQCTPNRLDLF